MLKIAIALGIAFEWIFGPGILNLRSLEFSVLRTLCAVLAAWMALEGVRVLIAAAMSLDPRPPGGRRPVR